MKEFDRIKKKVRIVKENRTVVSNNTDKVVSNIKSLYIQGKLVPVICEDMYEYRNLKGESQSLHSYIVETMIDNYNLQNKTKIKLTEKELKDIINESYYGMTLLREKIGYDLYIDIYNTIINEDNNEINNGICLKAEVLDFLNTCKPSLIVTTNCFPILEKELGSSYKSYWYELETKSDTPLPKKCIYHLFGKAKLDNSNWGYNDKQLLRFLRSANSSKYELKNLTTCISKKNTRKTLLVLGNDAPDWLFRFILSPIYGEDVYDDGIGFYISNENRVEVGGLEQFLREIKFRKDSQLIDVLKKATNKIRDITIPLQARLGNKYDFFVAHASEDKEVATKLVEILRENGLKVWVDFENDIDGHYWQRIIDALKQSSYFMPLVTDNYIQKNKPKHDEVQHALHAIGINEISFKASECENLEKHLDGVQIELLLAAQWVKVNEKDPYSIPVIQKGLDFWGNAVTPDYVKSLGDGSRHLPQELFFGIQMYEFDASSPEKFKLNWEKYKLNKKQ